MPDRPFTYGARIYDNCGVDQIEWLVDRLNSKRETKSATFGLLIPGSKSPNPPCLTTVDAKIREDKLGTAVLFQKSEYFWTSIRKLPGILDVTRKREEAVALRRIETRRPEPLSTVADDAGNGRNGFNVVDNGGTRVQTFGNGNGGFRRAGHDGLRGNREVRSPHHRCRRQRPHEP